MQHGRNADPGTKALGIGGDLDGGFGRGLEQDAVERGLVLISKGGDGRGQRVDHMKVRHGQKLRLALFQPLPRRSPLALRAVPIPAAIVSDNRVAASGVLAARNVPAGRGGAATLDCTHYLQLAEAHMTGIGAAPRRPEVAEDIRDLQGGSRQQWQRGLVPSFASRYRERNSRQPKLCRFPDACVTEPSTSANGRRPATCT